MAPPSPEVETLAPMVELLGYALDHPGPAFGTPAWLALTPTDPARHGPLVLAAWSWWAAENGIGAPARRELLDQAVDEAVSAELKAASEAVCVGEDWSKVARTSRYVRAALRAREEAQRPRPHDYPGRTERAA